MIYLLMKDSEVLGAFDGVGPAIKSVELSYSTMKDVEFQRAPGAIAAVIPGDRTDFFTVRAVHLYKSPTHL